jgi:hypothetical protein
MCQRFPVAVSIGVAAFLTFTCGVAGAEEDAAWSPGPHRIEGSLGAVFATTLVDSDGHWVDGGIGVTAGSDYGFRMLHGLDVRVGATYLDLGTMGSWPVDAPAHQRALLPWVGLRPYLCPSDSVELGLTLRVGGYFLWVSGIPDDGDQQVTHTHAYSGMHYGIAPDIRIALSPTWALAIAPEAAIGSAKDNGSIRGFYLRDQASLVSFGASAGVVLAP